MVKEFKVGIYYKYLGNERKSSWESGGKMDFVLDHKPYRCTAGCGYHVKFDNSQRWYWDDGIENWIELAEDNIYKED